MRKVTIITAKRIIVEPGDATRYDFGIYRQGDGLSDTYSVFSVNNNFNYPRQINYWEAKNCLENNNILNSKAIYLKINPHTLLQVCLAVIEDW